MIEPARPTFEIQAIPGQGERLAFAHALAGQEPPEQPEAKRHIRAREQAPIFVRVQARERLLSAAVRKEARGDRRRFNDAQRVHGKLEQARHQVADVAAGEGRQLRRQPPHDLLAVVERDARDRLGADHRVHVVFEARGVVLVRLLLFDLVGETLV